MCLDKAGLEKSIFSTLSNVYNPSVLLKTHPDRVLWYQALQAISMSALWLLTARHRAQDHPQLLTSVADDVVQDHQPLELQEQLPVSVLRKGFRFKTP